MNIGKLKFDPSQLNELDFDKLAGAPLAARLIAATLLAAAIAVAGWWFDWRDQSAQLERVQAEEQTLRSTFEIRQRRAANLNAYIQQIEEMNTSFGEMLRQLPSQAEISRLLEDISQTGLASGLEFELFQPQQEVKREFYSELPVKIRVRGDYHQFGRFVSGVANLPRIVTLHDVDIKPVKGNFLSMELTAKTYWYVEEGAAPKPAAPPRAPARRGGR
jgi:type IV pilus assembly protein PilO